METWKTIDTNNAEAFYQELAREFESLRTGHWLSDAANLSALLYHQLNDINWAGFYFRAEWLAGRQSSSTGASGSPPCLILGPFQGRPACVEIPFGKGVCGTAAALRSTQLVPDVHAFPGHIACDERSLSELVLPLIVENEVIGVLDLDSPLLNRFSDADAKGCEILVRFLLPSLSIR